MKETDPAAALRPLKRRFAGRLALIFATGPSLTKLWTAGRPSPWPSIVVNDAWKIVPNADVLYASDAHWWQHHGLVPTFTGVKVGCADCRFAGIVNLTVSGRTGFDERLGQLRHGENSGHAAVHLAAQLGASPIVLVGFDQRLVNGKAHYFGDHPQGVARACSYPMWAAAFVELERELTKRGIAVLNATPGSALTCFRFVDLEDVCSLAR